MLSWKTGFEIELLAPPGATREDLARRVAARHGGRVRRFLHQQAEPSVVPGHPVFENLTLAFEALNADGARIAAFVDDLTLQGDLDRNAAPLAGWYRIVADDGRLLRLAARHCDPDAPLEDVLAPLAALFGTQPQAHASGMQRIFDDRGLSVAIGAPLPGERERPCEIVTAPITHDHERVLGELLADARDAGFTVPLEGATHIHFDAGPLCAARTISNLVATLSVHGDALKQMLGCNPNCVRLGRWPQMLAPLVAADAFRALDWPDAVAALNAAGLSKYCDFNLLNIATQNAAKHTFEVRILPAHLEAGPVIAAATLFEALLRWCATPDADTTPDGLAALVAALPLTDADARAWRARAQT